MAILIPLVAIILGACVGSFCNVLIVRMHDGEEIGGRSRCVACRRTLAPTHLVPVVSWLWLRAKCAYCGEPIHWQYPAVEAGGSCIALVALAVSTESSGVIHWNTVVFASIFFFALLVLTVTDLRWGTVPVGFALGAAIFLGAWSAFFSMMAGGDAVAALMIVVSMVACWGFLAGLVALTGGRMMGEGDPSVGFLIGAGFTWPLGPIALLLAFIIGGACAGVLLIAGRVRRKDTIPFVPFLATGALVVFVWHAPLLKLLYDAFM